MIDPYKSQAITNLKKAQGQVAHVLKMVEENKYCTDIASQTNAAIGLLKKVNSFALESHLCTCGAKNLSQSDPNKKEVFVKELVRAFTVSNK